MRRYLADIDDPQTLEALNAAAVVRRTTRSLLRAMLPAGAGDEGFERLTSLPFVEGDRDGLFIHEAVRSAVAAALRSSDPAIYRARRRAAWRQLRAEVKSAGLAELWRYTADLLYLIENPVVRDAFFPSEAPRLIVEPACRDDGPGIEAIIDRHECGEGAAALRSWWRALPTAFHVVRDGSGTPCGFYCMFERAALDRWSPSQDDPLVRQWLAHERSTPVDSGERTLFLRRWLADQEGELPSAVQATCFLDIKRTYMELRPQLRRVYTTFCDENAWQDGLQKLAFRVLPGSGITFGAARYHSALLDFGPDSVDGWLSALAADELGVEESDLVDADGRRLKADGRYAALTRLESQVLQFLMHRQGSAVSRDSLRKEVWGHRGDGASNVVDVIVRSLRKKLGSRASTIETVSGVGYRFCPERRLATLLFVDIVHSTERALALGDARWRALLDRFHGGDAGTDRGVRWRRRADYRRRRAREVRGTGRGAARGLCDPRRCGSSRDRHASGRAYGGMRDHRRRLRWHLRPRRRAHRSGGAARRGSCLDDGARPGRGLRLASRGPRTSPPQGRSRPAASRGGR